MVEYSNSFLDKLVEAGISCHRDKDLQKWSTKMDFDRNDQRRFLGVLFDSFIAGRQTTKDIKLLRDGDSGSFQQVGKDSSTVAISDVAQEILAGSTIVVNHFERCLPQVASRFMHIAKITGTLCHMNVYWTPRGGKGSGRHSDDHDVGVFQVYGEKRWKLWLDGECNVDLEPSDFIYLKHGVEHDPHSLQLGSIHITFGYSNKAEEGKIEKTVEFYNNSKAVPESGIDTYLMPNIIDAIMGTSEYAPSLPDETRIFASEDELRYESSFGVALLSKRSAERVFDPLPKPGFRVSASNNNRTSSEAFSVYSKLALSGVLQFGDTSQ